jgi:hypothetical protein
LYYLFNVDKNTQELTGGADGAKRTADVATVESASSIPKPSLYRKG